MTGKEKPAQADARQISSGQTESGFPPSAAPVPARISLIYESEDGRFCLFQDGDGHITAVRASALA